jgi:bifunctional non-homologous end joining protein LigD
LPAKQAPQLATTVAEPPDAPGWISEVKFDGYRILVFLQDGVARLVTRTGPDWTDRLPTLARALGRLHAGTALVDGELVALRPDGVSDFGALQAALSEGRDRGLIFYAFDLLHLDGWDLRPCRLADRRAALRGLSDWPAPLRFSDDAAEASPRMRRQACAMGLEGLICKRADAPYRAGRTRDWVKVKCQGREEFVVIGWTPPSGHRAGLGALHLGFHDPEGRLHYAGAVGTGFSDRELTALRRKLDPHAAPAPAGLLAAGDKLDRAIRWVRPELVGEVQYLAWTDAGRLRQATWLGLREDKTEGEVVRDIPAPDAAWRPVFRAGPVIVQAAARPEGAREAGGEAASPPAGRRGVGRADSAAEATPAPAKRRSGKAEKGRAAMASPGQATASGAVVTARPGRGGERVEGVRLTHGDRELWPGISKRDLAAYWVAVAEHALPEIAGRPLALVRCPEGVEGEHFFQKNGRPGFPAQIRAGEADGAPWLAIDDVAGLVACAQVAAIEIHAWGAGGGDQLHPDRLVFDLDPGEGVGMVALARAAGDVRERLEAVGLAAFCRTSGGKGLHVVAPLTPRADWDTAREWCRAFAERMAADDPDRYVARVAKASRRGRILVDWLRNGLGATAVASFSPRARPGAGVAARLAWREVTAKLDPAALTLKTMPDRLRRLRRDPWEGFAAAARPLPGDGERA